MGAFGNAKPEQVLLDGGFRRVRWGSSVSTRPAKEARRCSNMEGYQMIAELTDFMLGFYGTLHCVELQKLEIVGVENPCHAIVEALAKKLEELLAGRRIFRPVNGGQLGC